MLVKSITVLLQLAQNLPCSPGFIASQFSWHGSLMRMFTGWLRYVFTILLPAMLMSNRSVAQGNVSKKEVKTCVTPKSKPHKMKIDLQPVVVDPAELKTMVLGGWGTSVVVDGTMGITIPEYTQPSLFHQFKKFITDSVRKPSFNIFPNPVSPGSMLRTSFNTRKGQYYVQVLDNHGILLQEEKLAAHGDRTEIMIRLSKSVFPGLYTVLLTDDKRRRIDSQKLIVQ